MNDPVTMRTGALGSVIHVLRADAETVAGLAAVDWNRHFRLSPGSEPRKLDASRVLAGFTPEDVCEAVEKVRVSPILAKRTEAVSRIVLRRRRMIARVREEEERYSTPAVPAQSAVTSRP